MRRAIIAATAAAIRSRQRRRSHPVRCAVPGTGNGSAAFASETRKRRQCDDPSACSPRCGSAGEAPAARGRLAVRRYHESCLPLAGQAADRIQLAARTRAPPISRCGRLLLLRELRRAGPRLAPPVPCQECPGQAHCLASVGAAAASGVVLPLRLEYLIKIGTLGGWAASGSASRRSLSRSSRSA
jgi:hypothetical protein